MYRGRGGVPPGRLHCISSATSHNDDDVQFPFALDIAPKLKSERTVTAAAAVAALQRTK